MLVLSRKIGERVVIPNAEITVRVLEVKGNSVRLGFEAPRKTEIYREEIWCRMVDGAKTWEEEPIRIGQDSHH